MYRHNRKIIALIVSAISLVIVAAFGFMTYSHQKNVRDLAEQLIEAESNNKSIQFNQELRAVEIMTEELVSLVQSSFSLEQLKSQDDYMAAYVKSIEGRVKLQAQNAALTKSAYVYFLPQLDQKPHDIWYADLNGDGQVERQKSFPLSYYDGDVKWKQWYYLPLETRKPYWTDPYIGTIESDQDIIYFSYTAPIIVEGKVIAIAGADYYFNNMKAALDQYNLKRKSETFLVNKDFNVLIHPSISFGVNLFDYYPSLDRALINEVAQNKTGKFTYSAQGNDQQMMFYSQLENGWYLMFSLSDGEVAAQNGLQEMQSWLVLVLAILGVLTLLFILMRNLLLPLNRVRQSLQRMLTHTYDQPLPITDLRRKDDFGELARAVEQLRHMWQTTYSQMKQAETEMAETIQEKTQELLKTNEFLELSLTQLQEQNSEMNIANEKYELQLTKLQLLQDRLFKSEQLASLAYILLGLAYDLNSPIGNSTTMISYLKSERSNTMRKLQADQLKKQELIDFMTTLEESLELLERNMTMASKQVVQFKRLSSGQNHYVKSVFPLKDTLSFIFNQSTNGLDHMNLRLNVNVPDISVLADQGAFIQVFSNLLRYSIGFSYHQSSKGLIAIQGELLDESSVMLTYEDYGNTTPKAVLDTAFVPYLTTQFQEQPQIVQLNICYHIVTKIFEGSIRFEPQAENGNRFYMVLKLKITKA